MNSEYREIRPLSSEERKNLLQQKKNELSKMAKDTDKKESFKEELKIAESRGYKMSIAINARNPSQLVTADSEDKAKIMLREKIKDDSEPIIWTGKVIEYLPYSPPHTEQSVKIVKLMVDPGDVRFTTTDPLKIKGYQKLLRDVDDYFSNEYLNDEKNDIFLLVDEKCRPLPLALRESGYYK